MRVVSDDDVAGLDLAGFENPALVLWETEGLDKSLREKEVWLNGFTWSRRFLVEWGKMAIRDGEYP